MSLIIFSISSIVSSISAESAHVDDVHVAIRSDEPDEIIVDVDVFSVSSEITPVEILHVEVGLSLVSFEISWVLLHEIKKIELKIIKNAIDFFICFFLKSKLILIIIFYSYFSKSKKIFF